MPKDTIYTQEFFDNHAIGSSLSARRLLPVVKEIVHPKSVLDVGTGNGGWLRVWEKAGAKDVIGVDGDYVDIDKLFIAADKFVAHDLTTPLKLGRKFDLVMTLEVGEHIDEKYAKTFVRSLTRHSEVILFSAALPGQGGTHHVNERWPSYWAKHFSSLGYQCYDVLRPLVWDNKDIEVWYRQNCLLFATEKAAKKLKLSKNSSPLDIVHPELFTHHIAVLSAASQSPAPVTPESASRKARVKEALKKSPAGPALRQVNRLVRKIK